MMEAVGSRHVIVVSAYGNKGGFTVGLKRLVEKQTI